MSNFWTHKNARMLCMSVEPIAALHGYHVALTGGCLYRTGKRKDCDLVFYRERQAEPMNVDKFMSDLRLIGIQEKSRHGWMIKADTKDGLPLDLLFPEHEGDAYITMQLPDPLDEQLKKAAAKQKEPS